MSNTKTDLQAFDPLQSAIADFVAPVKSISVTNKESSESASETFRALKRLEKSVEEKRKELVEPHNHHVKKINEFAKQVIAPINAALDHIKAQQIAFERVLEAEREAQRKIEREEQRKREELAAAAIKAAQDDAIARARALQEEADTAAMFDSDNGKEAADKAKEEIAAQMAAANAEAARIEFETKKAHWDQSKEIKSNKVQGVRRTWKGVVVDESLVPHEYFTLDQVKINKAVSGGAREIPGVSITEEIGITSR